ncbi:ribonuclease T2 family protein [Acinetobacter rudis]|uniref:ribonuclease T2 family protein n=1 Tax=Acinetobacter rudis TaxID=632955 RepID=UPI003DA75BBA
MSNLILKKFSSPYWQLKSFILLALWMICGETFAADAQLQGYVMQIQMTPAVCSMDQSSAKQRKCMEGYSLTITGLLPEVRPGTNCRTNSSANLSPIQTKVIAKVMPDENGRSQLWHEVGGCVPMNASQYFRTVISYAEKLKVPSDLTGYENKVVDQAKLRAQFLRLNPSLPSQGIRFSCQNRQEPAVLTEVKVCYHVNGHYKQCSSRVVANCPNDILIKSSY